MPHIEEPERLRAPEEKKPRETSGQWLWKTLRPAGCVLVLAMAVLMVAYCLTQGRAPIRGYTPPHTTEYYASHPDELLKELEQNVLPEIGGAESCELEDGRVRLTFRYEDFVYARSVLLRYFDESLLDLVQAEKAE